MESANENYGYGVRAVLLIVITAISFGSLVPGCTYQSDDDLSTIVSVFGPLRGYVEDENGERKGFALDEPIPIDDSHDEPIPTDNSQSALVRRASYVPPHYAVGVSGRVHGTFRVVESGPIFVQFLTQHIPEGFLTSGADRLSEALFFISAKPEATVSMDFRTGQDPDDLRLEIDHDSDGTVDEEIAPISWWDDDEPDRSTPASRADVTELSDGRVKVSLRRTVVPDDAGSEGNLYYFRYPQDDVAQLYSEPLILSEPTYLLFGAFSDAAQIGPLRELKILGGLGPDIKREVPTDGSPVAIEFEHPGQKAVLSYQVETGDQVDMVLDEVSLGILNAPEEVDVAERITNFRPSTETGTKQWTLDPQWGYTGRVVVRLTNQNEHAPLLEVDGEPVRIEVSRDSLMGSARFEARAGGEVQLYTVDIVVDDDRSVGVYRVTVYNPDGSVLRSREKIEKAGDISSLTLSQTGTHLIRVVGGSASTTGSVTLDLRSDHESSMSKRNDLRCRRRGDRAPLRPAGAVAAGKRRTAVRPYMQIM